ncbi:MAG: hypothetical protein PWP65_1161 [Clostridia bacterium]|nr:hypothetical protein [Clostridia bacterium]
MARLEELEIAQIDKEQLEKLKEAERLINSAGGTERIYLMALRSKKAPPG